MTNFAVAIKLRVTQYFITAVIEACSELGSIRLTQFTNDLVGRLEVCSGGRWGSVCGNGATNDIATVACRELGHAASGGWINY